MEELIELLNEYEKKGRKSEFYEWEKGVGGEFNLFRRDTYDEEGSHIYSDTADTYVISKKFGFIQRLVENDKIDLDKIYNEHLDYEFYKQDYGEAGYWYRRIGLYKSLLCGLSISDTPIEFLCDILKD